MKNKVWKGSEKLRKVKVTEQDILHVWTEPQQVNYRCWISLENQGVVHLCSPAYLNKHETIKSDFFNHWCSFLPSTDTFNKMAAKVTAGSLPQLSRCLLTPFLFAVQGLSLSSSWWFRCGGQPRLKTADRIKTSHSCVLLQWQEILSGWWLHSRQRCYLVQETKEKLTIESSHLMELL